jgi:hypothetical protein
LLSKEPHRKKEQMNHSRPCFAYFVACLANSSGVNLPAFT